MTEYCWTIVAEAFGPDEGTAVLAYRRMIRTLVDTLAQRGIDVGTTNGAASRLVRLVLRVGIFPGAPEPCTVQYGQASGNAGRYWAKVLAEQLAATTGQPWAVQRIWGTLLVMAGDQAEVPSIAIYLLTERVESEVHQVRDAIVQAILAGRDKAEATVPQAMPTIAPDAAENTRPAPAGPTPPKLADESEEKGTATGESEPASEAEEEALLSSEEMPPVPPEPHVGGSGCPRPMEHRHVVVHRRREDPDPTKIP